ncbi:MAG: DUF5104 domain-containing protein [Oscillospiraceae bacterium]|nr:DUF5104 domain-containing protein [Oscillospiraceae bacterium]
MFDRIWAWIFAFLLSIFPSLDRYSPPLDVKQSVATVISAIKTRDIDTIEAFMCKNIKDSVPDLRGEIGKMIDTIQGEITSHSSKSYENFYSSKGAIRQSVSVSEINTSTFKYLINITWEIYNNFSLEERGIRYIGLRLVTDDGYDETLPIIKATNGIGQVHS